METMYAPQNNGPHTTLVKTINSTETSITVADASMLPEAPNVLTIGRDEDAELVLMESVTGNILTVRRGFNGTTAKEWTDETWVYRAITAQDVKALQERAAISVSIKDDGTGTADQPETINAQTLAGMTLTQIKEMLEPVGTIFEWLPVAGNALDLSTPEKVAAYKGFGTWQQMKDRFLLGAGDAYAAGSTGGEAMHTLIVDEMPKHQHDGLYYSGYGGQKDLTIALNQGDLGYKLAFTLGGSGDNEISTRAAGGGMAHNNMPPYLTVYIWQRIA